MERERDEEGRHQGHGLSCASKSWMKPGELKDALYLHQLMPVISTLFIQMEQNDLPRYIEPSTRLTTSSCAWYLGPFRFSASKSCSRANDDIAVPSFW